MATCSTGCHNQGVDIELFGWIYREVAVRYAWRGKVVDTITALVWPWGSSDPLVRDFGAIRWREIQEQATRHAAPEGQIPNAAGGRVELRG